MVHARCDNKQDVPQHLLVKAIWTTDLLLGTKHWYNVVRQKGNTLLQELRKVAKNLDVRLVKTHPLPPVMPEV